MDPPASSQEDKPPASLRDPSKLFFQHDSIRRSIIVAYWIVIILALPLWWYTTSIERLPLPASRVAFEVNRSLQLPIQICINEREPRISTQLQNELHTKLSGQGVGVNIHVIHNPNCESSNKENSYIVIPGNTKTVYHRQITFPLDDPASIHELAETLLALLVPDAADPEQENRVAQFAPRYRLAFSLLNEDASSGNNVIGWDIENALKMYLSPVLDSLAHLHNFTIESQVQFHAPLAFDVRALTYEDLTVFVNSAQWTLSSSVSNDPVLHFIVFVSSANDPNLQILNSDDTISTSDAFLLPQWGGIVLYNPQAKDIGNELSDDGLRHAFSTFSDQLLALLGISQLPSNLQRDARDNSLISDWQLDALLRRRTLETTEGTQDTLRSFTKLVNQIENMPVRESVRDDVQGALDALSKVHDTASTSLSQTFTYSAQAFDLASRAFFNPGMLGLLYFPAEHKYAVYTPLFASAVIPLFVAALREFLAWKRQWKAGLARA